MNYGDIVTLKGKFYNGQTGVIVGINRPRVEWKNPSYKVKIDDGNIVDDVSYSEMEKVIICEKCKSTRI